MNKIKNGNIFLLGKTTQETPPYETYYMIINQQGQIIKNITYVLSQSDPEELLQAKMVI